MRQPMRAVILAAVLFAVSPLRAQTPAVPQPPAENLAAARELVQVTKATDQFKSVLPLLLQNLKPAIVQNRPDVEKAYDTIMPVILQGALRRLDQFADMLALIYAENFNLDELHDLIAFYRTPTGQKFVARQPIIARASMAAGQRFGQTLVADLRQQIIEELAKQSGAK